MSTTKIEKSHDFKDKRGQDRRQNKARARKVNNERRRQDRRNMEFSELPWWLQRNYVDSTISNTPTKVKKPQKRKVTRTKVKSPKIKSD